MDKRLDELFEACDLPFARGCVATAVDMALRMDGMTNDAANDFGVFVAEELHQTLSRVEEEYVNPGSARNLFPITSELAPTTQTFKYYVYDKVGMAKIIADFTDNLDLADINAHPVYGEVFRFGNATHYSLDEMKDSQATGKNLPARRVMVARDAHEQLINKLIFQGSPAHNIKSVFDNANIPEIESDGWIYTDNKTMFAANMVAELDRAIEMINENTHGQVKPNMVAMPPRCRKILNQLIPNTFVSYGEQWKQANPGIEFVSVTELNDIDGKGTAGVLVYEKNPLNMSFEIPEAFNSLPAQPQGLHFVVPHTSKFSGLMVYRPTSMVMITDVIQTKPVTPSE